MLGLRLPTATRGRDDGEKPFWISYSDLMSALMVLFLVVMSVSLLTITQELLAKQQELETKNQALIEQQKELELAKRLMDALKKKRDERTQAIESVMGYLQQASDNETFRGRVGIGRDRLTVDFGEAARFGRGDHRLSPEGAALLRAFVPEVLKAVDSDAGRQWFKRVVVEGFTDTDGSYLYNLDLSLERAQSVVCALMAPGADALTAEQQRRVRELFLVGGFSFNSAKTSKEESRRVELRLEFQNVEHDEGDTAPAVAPLSVEAGKCQLG